MKIRHFHCIAILSVLLVAVLSPQAIRAQTAPAPVKSLTTAYNASGQDLFGRLTSMPGNVVISPYSIGSAMAMAASGARGETESQMLSVLKQTLPRSGIEAANASALATLNAYDTSKAPPICPTGMRVEGKLCKGPRAVPDGCPYPTRLDGAECVGAAVFLPFAKLAVANALMITKAGAITPDYTSLLKSKFSAEVFKDAKLADINAWVHRKTEGKIDKIIEKLDPNSAAVLLNAVYFKAGWQSPFEKRNTSDDFFNLTASNKVKVPMMHRVGSYALQIYPEFRAIKLLYLVPSLSMVVVLPERVDGLREIGERLDAEGLSKLLADVRTAPNKRVDLALPRFKASYKADLVPLFRQAGLRLPFENHADFSGMTGQPPSRAGLKIGAIVHRAVIEVEEEGTEAAAATGIEMRTTAMRPDKLEMFQVDRPFLFYLVDDATGAILFQGRINDPR